MLTTLDSLTADTLTALLREAGHLPVGMVAEVQQHPNAAFNSQVAHLRLTYSDTAPVNAASAMLVKLNRQHWGKHEVLFYRSAAAIPKLEGIIPTCFVAQYEEKSGNSLLLL